MKQINSIAQLLAETDHSRTIIETTILAQDPLNLEIQGVCGHWSVKDIMVHITAWENRMMEWLNQIIFDDTGAEFLDPELSSEAIDAYNAQIYRIYADIDLQKIKTAFLENHQNILDYIARLPEEQLFDPDRPRFNGDHPLWHLVAANTFWHYQEHLTNIEKQSWFQKAKK